jgi:anti-sigma28 factor (negative regulator of flagellin synthesis)
MANIRESRAPLDYVTGTARNERAKIPSSLLYTMGEDPKRPYDERVERVNRIRDSIVNGYYRVRSADLAQKLAETMREAADQRFCRDAADPTSLPSTSVSSTRKTTDATFRPRAASESAEEEKHE